MSRLSEVLLGYVPKADGIIGEVDRMQSLIKRECASWLNTLVQGRDNELMGSGLGPRKGIPVDVVIKRAETHISRNTWPGVKALAKIIGCSPSTIDKAVKRSPKLKARKAEHEALKHRMREQLMTGKTLDEIPQTTEADPLAKLIAEQEVDMQIDGGKRRLARRPR